MPTWARILIALLVASAPSFSLAQSDGSGDSYWGPIPAPDDSVTTIHQTTPRAAWEWPLYVPWRVASAPFWLLNEGTKGAVVVLDESGVIYRINRLLSPLELPYGFTVSGVAGNLTGVGAGLNLFHDELGGSHNRFQAKFSISSNGHERYSLGYGLGRDDGSYLEFGGGYRLRPNARFFGIGPTSLESARSFYTQEVSWAGADYRHQFSPVFAAQIGVLYSTMGHRGPEREDDRPSIEAEFESALPMGYGSRSDGIQVSLSLEHDDTDGTGRPRSGGVRRVRAGYFSPREEIEADFADVRLELQQFFQLWHDRALALRLYGSWLTSRDAHFQRLMTNDDPDVLRGFTDFRFRDRGMAVLTAEYRYPVWSFREVEGGGIDAYAFFDWGQVFSDREDIGLRHLSESYGVGFRLVGRRGFGGRFEIGFSDEDVVFRLRTDQLFQFHKRGFYHGRTPVPAR